MMEDGYMGEGMARNDATCRGAAWYGFYGATLQSDAAFEGKMEELCCELGERGKER